jgi:hypothetical protein
LHWVSPLPNFSGCKNGVRMSEQKTVVLPLDLVNAVFQYLGTKPFQEVHQLVGAIQQAVQPQLAAPNEADAPAADA